MEPVLVDENAADYLNSLGLAENVRRVAVGDGASLWRVCDDHFVVLICSESEHEHTGLPRMLRALPASWAVFYIGVNPDDYYEVRHYGPSEGT